MRTRRSSKRGRRFTIQVGAPFALRDEQGRVRRDSNGDPIYFPRPAPFVDNSLYNVNTRRKFIEDFCRLDGPLTFLDMCIFMRLLGMCHNSVSEILYDDRSGEPSYADADRRYVQAELRTPGNVTRTFVYDELMQMVRASDKSIRTSLDRLESTGLIKPRPIPKQSITKLREARGETLGRPLKCFRYEINPLYAWNGSLSDGIGYLTTGLFEEGEANTELGDDDEEIPADTP